MIKPLLISLCLVCFSFGFSQIRITEPRHEFGDIFEEKGVVYADFRLVNPYPGDTIYINSIETSCGCTAIVSNDTIIYPKSSILLKVSYDPKGRVGLFHKSVKIKTTTGESEKNELYLKLTGNVVPKVKNIKVTPSLIEYEVAPIYFYPITQYDTSYLDFNYIIDFINDITYEVDYYQFSKVGFEINVRDSDQIEDIEFLLRFSKYKFLREMKDRGYGMARLFFTEPIFTLDHSIPSWALGEIKVYSVNFNQNELTKSHVKLTNPDFVDNNVYLLDMKSPYPIQIDTLKNHIDFNNLSHKLLEDSILTLNVDYKIPESYNSKKALKFEEEVYKMMYKELKDLVGIEKYELVLIFDSVKTHASTNHQIRIWSENELEVSKSVNYQVKQDVIVSPLLPTLKQHVFNLYDEIDTTTNQFKQFWNSLISYTKTADYITLVLESSTSYYPKSVKTDPLYYSRQRSIIHSKFIQTKFLAETGDSIKIEIKNIILGPKYNKREFTKPDYMQYEYVKLIPVYKNPRILPIKEVNARPYIVNYDYYFVGVDTNSFVFRKFANYVIYEIQKNGFLEIKTESSASNIPVDNKKSNAYLAYKHLEESKNRFYEYLRKRLVDPNRLLITEERILVQGIPYSKKTPVVRYRRYQYVTFIPNNYLMNRK